MATSPDCGDNRFGNNIHKRLSNALEINNSIFTSREHQEVIRS